MKSILSLSEQHTLDTGEALGKSLSKGISIALKGDLGAGKTTFVKGLAKGLGVSGAYPVTSPTFAIMNEYQGAVFSLYHLDLYRLSSADELDHIGFDDILDQTHVIVVEWPQILQESGFLFDMEICFEFDAKGGHRISAFASEQSLMNLLGELFS